MLVVDMPSGRLPETDSLVEENRPFADALAAQILRGLPARVDRAEVNAAAGLAW